MDKSASKIDRQKFSTGKFGAHCHTLHCTACMATYGNVMYGMTQRTMSKMRAKSSAYKNRAKSHLSKDEQKGHILHRL